MRPWTAAAALIVLLAGTAGADFNSDYAGTSAAEFLKLGADSRGVSMGHAMGAAADDASAVYWNPAGLSQLNKNHVTFTHSFMYQSVFYDFFSYARPVRPVVAPRRREFRPSGRGTLAVAVMYLNAGTLKEVDNTGTLTGGAFTPHDLSVMAGWGASLTEVLDLGLTLKYVDCQIQSSARTGAADVGARLRLHLLEWPYVFSFSAHNMGGKLRFHDERDPLPLTLRIGNTLRPIKQWLLSADVVFQRDNRVYANLGTEARIPIEDNLAVAIRGGWSGRTSSGDLDGLTGLSFGAGLEIFGLGADYAWAPFGLLGDTHRISLGFKF